MSFYEKLNEAIARNNTLLIAAVEPNPEIMPEGFDKLWDWLQFTIEATSDRVCAYKPTLGFYQALGARGLELLNRVLEAIPSQIPVILDAKHGDINSSTLLARTVFSHWQVDAITLNPYAGQDQVAPFLLYADKGIFVLCHTSNPAAVSLQEYPSPESPFYLKLVEEARTWGTPEQVALEVGSTEADVFAKVRETAPERIILARSIWGEENNLEQIMAAGLDRSGAGLLIPLPLEYLVRKDKVEEIPSLQQEVNQIRNNIVREGSSCQVWMSDVCLLNRHPYQDLILQIYDLGCLLFGEYVQASGATFPYYIDLRTIISNPQVFHLVLQAYGDILQSLSFDRIAGIPYGSLPTATGLALNLNRPMIFPRKEVKAHGTRRVIEGEFHAGEKVVVVDDILISGQSVMQGAKKLESAGLEVEDIVVFIDHGGGVKERLQENGYRGHSVLTIAEIVSTLYAAGRINEEQYNTIESIESIEENK